MPTTSLKLVHTSDVHLDGRYTHDVDGDFRNVAERAFAAVVTCAKTVQADMLLIVGDLFDNNRVRDHDIEFVCNQFQRVDCPVVLLPGNHDVHDGTSVWARMVSAGVGAHVHALLDHDGDRLSLEEQGATVWGRAMAEHTPDNVPLHDAPDPQNHVWNIGMAHGLVVEQRAGYGSSQITHEEIRASGFDYLALGHVHVWGDMSQGPTRAYYSGSPVAAYASANGGHVAITTLCPESGVNVDQHQVDWRQ